MRKNVKLFEKKENGKWKKIMKKEGAIVLAGIMSVALFLPMGKADAAVLTGTASASGTMGGYKPNASLSLAEHSATARTGLSEGSGSLYVSVHYEYINNGTVYYVSKSKSVNAPTYAITVKDKRGNSANKGAKSSHKVSAGGYSWNPGGLEIKGSVFAKNPVSDN